MWFPKKEIFDRLYKHARWIFGGAEFLKKEILHNQIVGIYFQKRKDFLIFTGKKLPKKEILMAYVTDCGKIFPKKESQWILHRKNISKKGNFDGLHNYIILYSNEPHKPALQHGYYGVILNGLLKQVA